jgi:hypothetical protein
MDIATLHALTIAPKDAINIQEFAQPVILDLY